MYDPCAPVEHACDATPTCSVFGDCDDLAGQLASPLGLTKPHLSDATLAAQRAALISDTTPPVIELLGTGDLIVDGSRSIMVTTVVVGSGPYMDGGAVAWDMLTGDPTRKINITDAIKVGTLSPMCTLPPRQHTSVSSPSLLWPSLDQRDQAST